MDNFIKLSLTLSTKMALKKEIHFSPKENILICYSLG